MLQVEMVRDVSIVKVRASCLGPQAEEALARCHPLLKGTRIILDLSEVEVIGSVAMNVLLSFLKQVKSCDGQLVLIGLRGECLKVMRFVGLTSIFEIHNDISSAIAAEGPATPRASSN